MAKIENIQILHNNLWSQGALINVSYKYLHNTREMILGQILSIKHQNNLLKMLVNMKKDSFYILNICVYYTHTYIDLYVLISTAIYTVGFSYFLNTI